MLRQISCSGGNDARQKSGGDLSSQVRSADGNDRNVCVSYERGPGTLHRFRDLHKNERRRVSLLRPARERLQ